MKPSVAHDAYATPKCPLPTHSRYWRMLRASGSTLAEQSVFGRAIREAIIRHPASAGVQSVSHDAVEPRFFRIAIPFLQRFNEGRVGDKRCRYKDAVAAGHASQVSFDERTRKCDVALG